MFQTRLVITMYAQLLTNVSTGAATHGRQRMILLDRVFLQAVSGKCSAMSLRLSQAS